MLETPRASVIMPHLNEPNLLACLQSLEQQRSDGIPFEVIVVDNGSTILPTATVATFPGMRLVCQPVPGPGPARNLGASEARAPLLLFIDSDCIAMPHWLSRIVEFFERNSEVNIVGGDIRIQPTDASRLTSIEGYESVYSYRARLYVEHYGFAATGNMAVRSDAFSAVGPFGGIGTMEDTAWGQRATGMGHRIAYLADARVQTPSCRSFLELARRWDRHVAHEFAELDKRPVSKMKWLAKSAAMALSPSAEIIPILRSDRLESCRDRLLTLSCLARVRLYRARRMLSLLWHDNGATMIDFWNREKH